MDGGVSNRQGGNQGGSAPHKSLLDIKGVGPVNASLLVANRIMSVNHLQEIYHQLCKQDAKEFQEFLHNVVGFRNSAHSRHVVDYPAEPGVGTQGESGEAGRRGEYRGGKEHVLGRPQRWEPRTSGHHRNCAGARGGVAEGGDDERHAREAERQPVGTSFTRTRRSTRMRFSTTYS